MLLLLPARFAHASLTGGGEYQVIVVFVRLEQRPGFTNDAGSPGFPPGLSSEPPPSTTASYFLYETGPHCLWSRGLGEGRGGWKVDSIRLVYCVKENTYVYARAGPRPPRLAAYPWPRRDLDPSSPCQFRAQRAYTCGADNPTLACATRSPSMQGRRLRRCQALPLPGGGREIVVVTLRACRLRVSRALSPSESALTQRIPRS